MHNGLVGSWPRLRRRVEALIPDELYPSRIGTTDSEALFLAILGRGMIGSNTPREPVDAICEVLEELNGLVNSDGYSDRFRFTAALSNGRDLYAVRYAINDDANSLYYREESNSLVVASEPLDLDYDNWTAVENGSVLVSKADHGVEIAPLAERLLNAA